MSKQNKKLIEEMKEAFDQKAPSSTGINLQAGLDRTVKAVDAVADRADNNESDIFELQAGHFDVNGDGSKITQIFDANGDLVGSGGISQDDLDKALDLKVDKTDLVVDLAKKLDTPANDAAGTAGQIVSKTDTGTEWIDAPSGGGGGNTEIFLNINSKFEWYDLKDTSTVLFTGTEKVNKIGDILPQYKDLDTSKIEIELISVDPYIIGLQDGYAGVGFKYSIGNKIIPFKVDGAKNNWVFNEKFNTSPSVYSNASDEGTSVAGDVIFNFTNVTMYDVDYSHDYGTSQISNAKIIKITIKE